MNLLWPVPSLITSLYSFWLQISQFFSLNFFTSYFYSKFSIFGWKVQYNAMGKIFEVYKFAFLISYLVSTHNFTLEKAVFKIKSDTLSFTHFVCQTQVRSWLLSYLLLKINLCFATFEWKRLFWFGIKKFFISQLQKRLMIMAWFAIFFFYLLASRKFEVCFNF